MIANPSSQLAGSSRSAAFLLGLLCCLFTVTLHGQSWTPNSQEKALADLMKSASGQKRSFLTFDPILSKVARERAADMAKNNYFSHTSSDGHGANYLVEKAGFSLPSSYPNDGNNLESIAAGTVTASETWSGFMDSAPHKQHLLGEQDFYKSQTSYGVGFCEESSSEYRTYWVIITAPPQPQLPNVTIRTPAAGANLPEGAIAIAGNTSGLPAASEVQVSVQNADGSSAFQTISGVANWSGSISGLLPGNNTLRVRSLAANGVVLSQASVPVDYIVRRPITVAVTGEGSVGGFGGTTQRALNQNFTVVATPAEGWLFTGWTGAFAGKPASVTFKMTTGLTATANFVQNPFPAVRGGFNGLIGDSSAESGVRGNFNVQLTAAGQFSGRISYDGESLAIKGKFGLNGSANFAVLRKDGTTLNVQLALDVSGAGNGITGSIEDAGVITALGADHTVRAASAKLLAGHYTVSLPADPANTDLTIPHGDGYALLKVSATGRAVLTGALADGRTFSRAGMISDANTLALFVPLYAKTGALAGQLSFADQADSDFTGTLRWNKPARPSDTFFSAAFDVALPCLGARYLAPEAGESAVTLPIGEGNAAIVLGDGNLAAELVQSATLANNNQITAESNAVAGFSASINAKNGRFSGAFIHPATGASTPFRGVVLQKMNIGTGYFLGADQSGYANLAAAQ